MSQATQANYYVATNGHDAWSGTLPEPNETNTDGPFATLTRARDAIRQLKAAEGLNAPVTVMVRSGTYYLAEPLLLGPHDSGTEKCPITYMAYPGEKPVVTGGKKITGWQRGEGQLWVAEIPEVKTGQWYFRQLFVNGERRSRGRLPREGLYTMAGAEEGEQRTFRYEPGDINPNWHNLSDVEIVLHQFWTEGRMPIEAIDEEAHTCTLAGQTWRPITWCKGYWVENVFEGLDGPGAWYLDRQTGRLYYWPLPGEDMTQAEAWAPVTQQLVRLQGDPVAQEFVEHVVLRGLTFHYTSWDLPPRGYDLVQAELAAPPEGIQFAGYVEVSYSPESFVEVPAAIYAEAARHCAWEDCELAHTGAWGIELSRGCQENRIVGNHMFDLGAGAVRVGEPQVRDNDLEEAWGNEITDNRLLGGCTVYLGAPGIWIGQSSSNQVAHNEISGDFVWGISVGWRWNYMPPNRTQDNIIEYNHLHDLVPGLTTHGVLYFLGVQPGTMVRYNLIHDCEGACGIILDNACVGIVIENNLIYRMHTLLGLNYNDLGNIMRNNILAFGANAQIGRGDDRILDSEKHDQGGIFYHNIVYWQEADFISQNLWMSYDMIMDYNLYYDASGHLINFANNTLEEWQAHGIDKHSLVANPLFVDPDNGDFTLQPESPAFKLGFKPFDLSGVGPRPRDQ